MKHVFEQQQNQTIYEAKLLEIYEGSLQKHLEDSLRKELSAASFDRSKHRIVPINLLPKIISKVSGVYTEPCLRETKGNEIDDENMAYYESDLALDAVMNQANEYLNLFKYCAVEPFLDRGEPKLRCLPPTMFTVWTDDQINPLRPTVFVKYLGTTSDTFARTDTDGISNIISDNIVRDVEIFHVYSDEEFLVIDSNLNIRVDLMGDNQGVNHFGMLPIVYLNASTNYLIPLPNSDFFQMTLITGKLITDLNYATLFNSFSQLYSINLKSSKLSKNPDSFWDLKTEDGETGSIGSIKSDVDIEKVLMLIKETLALWFDSLGMKATGFGNIAADSAESGISKVIDNADIDEVRNKQKPIMKKAELELWKLLQAQHEEWDMAKLKPFSTSFDPSIIYSDPEPIVDMKTTIESAKLKYEAGLTSFRKAVQLANPELNTEDIEELILEIKAERTERTAIVSESLNNKVDEDLEE